MVDVPKDPGGYSLPISDPRFEASMNSPQYDVPDFSMLPDSLYEGADGPMAKKNSIYVSEKFVFISNVR